MCVSVCTIDSSNGVSLQPAPVPALLSLPIFPALLVIASLLVCAGLVGVVLLIRKLLLVSDLLYSDKSPFHYVCFNGSLSLILSSRGVWLTLSSVADNVGSSVSVRAVHHVVGVVGC